jgi:hypothetical protein
MEKYHKGFPRDLTPDGRQWIMDFDNTINVTGPEPTFIQTLTMHVMYITHWRGQIYISQRQDVITIYPTTIPALLTKMTIGVSSSWHYVHA